MAKKGGTYVCVPCGMEIVVTESGAAYSDILCCGLVMSPKSKAKARAKAAPKKKAAGKKAPAKKGGARKKAPAKKGARKKK